LRSDQSTAAKPAVIESSSSTNTRSPEMLKSLGEVTTIGTRIAAIGPAAPGRNRVNAPRRIRTPGIIVLSSKGVSG
jgi:hypothetical protein